MRDALLGLLTYILALGALVGVIVLCMWLYGPPQAERARMVAFIVGGGALAVALALISAAGLIVYGSPR